MNKRIAGDIDSKSTHIEPDRAVGRRCANGNNRHSPSTIAKPKIPLSNRSPSITKMTSLPTTNTRHPPGRFTPAEQKFRSNSRILLGAYAVTSALCSAVLMEFLPPSAQQFAVETFGVIEYFEMKGRDQVTSSAFFLSSIACSPLALASWHYSYRAGRRKAPPARPWLILAGLAYAVPLIAGMILMRPVGHVGNSFSFTFLNFIIRNELAYFSLVNLYIWTICAFICMTFIYPMSRTTSHTKNRI